MKARRSRTEATGITNVHKQLNSRIKRTQQTMLNHQMLRIQVCEKQDSLRGIFNKNQKQLCDFFIKYVPLSYSNINVKKIVAEKIDEVRLIKNSNKIYFGGVTHNMRNGEGVMIDDKGKIYEGNFKDNAKDGVGVEIYPNSNVYIGNFANNKKHGQGQFYWYNLSPPLKGESQFVEYYVGDWWGGLPDGKGSHQKCTGDIYDGEFKNGLKHGQGQQYFFNGDSYLGEYVNGLPEGFGTYFWADGSKFQGDFKQGLRNGHGIWISANEKEQYKGQYVLDKKCGYGEYSWANKFLYKGHFENDVKHGYGQLFSNNELEYEGEWANGQIVTVEKEKEKYRSDFSLRESSMMKTHKSDKLPSLTALKPPASAIVNRIKTNDFLKQSKFVSRSRSPKTNNNSLSLNRFGKTLALSKSKSKKKIENPERVIKKRPLSFHNKHHIRPLKHLKHDESLPKYELIVRKCNRRNCGCNYSVALDQKLNMKGRKRPLTYTNNESRFN